MDSPLTIYKYLNILVYLFKRVRDYWWHGLALSGFTLSWQVTSCWPPKYYLRKFVNFLIRFDHLIPYLLGQVGEDRGEPESLAPSS